MKRRLVAVFAGLLAASLPLAALTPPLPPPLPAGPDFQVNATTLGWQDTPDVARDAAGNFVVVWADTGLGTGQYQVMARLFAPSGAPKSGEILVWPVSHPDPRPRVAMTPQGAFVVVWMNESGVSMRRFDRFAEPNSAAFPVAPEASADKHSPDVAMDAAGNAAVVWAQDDSQRIFLQRFDAEDRPLEAPVRVDQASVGRRGNPRVALNAAGSILVTWNDRRELDVYVRRFDGPSGSWGPERPAHTATTGQQDSGAPALYPEGDGLVVYQDQSLNTVFVHRLDVTGAPAGSATAIGNAFLDALPDVAVASNGTALAVWSGDGFDGSGIHGSLFTRDGEPVDLPFLISTPSPVNDWYPSVAGGAAEGFVVAWGNGDLTPTFPITTPVPTQNGRDGSLFGVFARVLGDGRCLAGSEVLCLRGGRFEARVTWTNPATGETGVGRALPLTADTGALWFFNEDNLELVVKVLDGGAVNGHFWVYYGALSDVRYILEVTDTETGKKKIYRNPPRRLASRADINAFPNAGQTFPAVTAPKAALTAPASKAAGSCQPSPEALCLAGDRFRVTVEFADPRLSPAVEHQAKAIPLTGDTGTFYFFHAENIELMIKVLDGRPHNGHFWVYYGALSDVAYRIAVEDTETGQRKTYDNVSGRLISRADVGAFQDER
ncbi:MAG TPA: hypothetical protein VLE27_01145 [Thermoanaerobaculia bacterium]|nr:hypothetical protein [Thermoanaerobaculia bacterium]